MEIFPVSDDSKLKGYEVPICVLCGKRLYKERTEELNHSSIIYFNCRTLIEAETKTEEAKYCSGRYHILVK